jgi:hypothetical protein
LFDYCRDILQLFKIQELIHWKDLLKNFEIELKNGINDDSVTNVFIKNDDGNQRWEDFKVRVVEHVNHFDFIQKFFYRFFFDIEYAYYG